MTVGKKVVLFPAAFLMNLNLSMINFAVIFYLKDCIAIKSSMIGWFFAAGSVSYTLSCIVLAPFQHRIPAALSLLISTVLAAAAVIFIPLTETPAAALACYIVFASAPALFWPPLVGLLSDGLDNRSLNSALSGFNIAWSSGVLAGPFLGGIIAERNLTAAFGADAALLGITAIILAAGFICSDGLKTGPVGSAEGAGMHEIMDGGRGTKLRYSGWIGVFSAYVMWGMLSNIFPLFVRDRLGLGEGAAGSLLFVKGITTTASFYLIGKTGRWHFRKKPILLTQLLIMLMMASMYAARSVYVYYAVMACFGLLFSSAYSGSIFHGSAGALNRGRRMAVHESVLTAGVITGSVGGGYFYQYHSIQYAFAFALMIAGAGFVVQLFLASRLRDPEPAS